MRPGGRGGCRFLEDDPRVFHLRLVADAQARLRRVMEHRWLAEDAARSLMEQTDQQRAQFYQAFFGVDWTNPLGYHVTVNTGRMQPEGVNLIALMAERHWARGANLKSVVEAGDETAWKSAGEPRPCGWGWHCLPASSPFKGDGHVETWGRILALSVGGVAGVNARYWLGVWINRWASSQFPWATFSINVSGAFAIGFLTAILARWSPHSNLRLMILVGFLGGYTTFSTFAFEIRHAVATRRVGLQPGQHGRERPGRLRRRGARRRIAREWFSPLGPGCWAWDNRGYRSRMSRGRREQPADDSPAIRLERLLEAEADLGETGQ